MTTPSHRRRYPALDPNPDVDLALRYGGYRERQMQREHAELKALAVEMDARAALRRAQEDRSARRERWIICFVIVVVVIGMLLVCGWAATLPAAPPRGIK